MLLYYYYKNNNNPIDKNKLKFVTRVRTWDPNQCKPIIACFQNEYIKEDFTAAARAYNKRILSPNLILASKETVKYLLKVLDHTK